MDKKKAYLIEKTGLKAEEVFAAVQGQGSMVLPGRMWGTYYIKPDKEEFACYKVNSKGLFKKEYSMGQVIKLKYSDIQRAEFGKHNGNLWLQLSIRNELVPLAGIVWKEPAPRLFLESICKQVDVVDLHLAKLN